MRLLIIDDGALALDVALRAMREGHQVKWYFHSTPRLAEIGKGLVERVDDWQPWLNWADLVYFPSNTKYLRAAEQCQSKGIPFIGCTREQAAWETDRTVGDAVLRKAKIDTLPCKEFTDYDAAIRHVKKTLKRYVSKTGGENKSLSYVSKSPDDLIYMLNRWKKADTLKEAFILQDFVGGTEMAVSGWFGPGGWHRQFEENWEFKKLMNGDLGCNTGEQGTVMRFVRKSKLADMMLRPLTPQLEAIGYCGNIDVNCIIDDKGKPWPLEFTMRSGWPSTNIQAALYNGDFIEWMMTLTQGKPFDLFSESKVAVGVVLSIPDYPYSHLTKKEVVGVPIFGITTRNWQNLHLCECSLGEVETCQGKEKLIVTAGDYILVATGTSATVQGAREAAYARLNGLTIPNSAMWRTDIGRRLSRQLPELQAKGFATGMLFS